MSLHKHPLLTPKFSKSLMGITLLRGNIDWCLTHARESKSSLWKQDHSGLHSHSLLGQKMHEIYTIRERESQVGAILSPPQDSLWQSESSPTAKIYMESPTSDPRRVEGMTTGETDSITQSLRSSKRRDLTGVPEEPMDTCRIERCSCKPLPAPGAGPTWSYLNCMCVWWLTASLKDEYEFVRQDSGGLAEHSREGKQHVQRHGTFRGQ